MNFPIADVVKNVKHFMNLVKRATGNIRDPKTEKEKGGGSRPGKSLHLDSVFTVVPIRALQSFQS